MSGLVMLKIERLIAFPGIIYQEMRIAGLLLGADTVPLLTIKETNL